MAGVRKLCGGRQKRYGLSFKHFRLFIAVLSIFLQRYKKNGENASFSSVFSFFSLVCRNVLAALGVEVAEVCPLIIGILRRGYRQRCLAAIEKTFHENRIRGLLAAVEDELDVARLTGLPVLVIVLHFIGIFWIAVCTIDA